MSLFDVTDSRRFFVCNNWGLFKESTPLSQIKKLQEELDELEDALFKLEGAEDTNAVTAAFEEAEDAIGDMTVVIGNIATMLNTNIPRCYKGAVDVISKRKGKIVDGIFIKEEQ